MSPSSPHLVKTKHQESNEETKGQNAQNNPSQSAGGSRKEVNIGYAFYYSFNLWLLNYFKTCSLD